MVVEEEDRITLGANVVLQTVRQGELEVQSDMLLVLTIQGTGGDHFPLTRQ